MKTFFLLLILAVCACSTPPEPAPPPIDKDGINAALKAKRKAFARCFDKASKAHPIFEAGKVILKWTIDVDGKPAGTEVESSTLNIPKVEKCLVRTVNKMQFDLPAEPVKITYPFEFRD